MSDEVRVHVPLGERRYDIVIGDGVLQRAGELVRIALEADGQRTSRLAIISNARVFGLYGARLRASLRQAGFSVSVHFVGDGERYKTLRTVERLYGELAEQQLDRTSAIVALGGGVVGDIAGFVAATFLRGIAYVQIPTTLLAAIDSSIGGKTGVNLPQGKNLVGAFHQPRLVLADVATLRTLPPREMEAGLCEALKYGVIRDARLFDHIVARMEALKNGEATALVPMIRRCCEIKAEIVRRDERESGLRRILNFGHTFGHALEAVTRYRRLKHGEAVGYGMLMAGRLAVRLKMFAPEEAERLRQAIAACGPFPSIADLDPDEILATMRHDKKARAGRLTFVLPTRIGHVTVRDDIPPRIVRALLRESLRDLSMIFPPRTGTRRASRVGNGSRAPR
ncbi:MAG: 3-dehydroquinate synthase [Blastocatellia bacterium]|nr:3-dehydroquinate synthase [Blastocatellia bacterium]